MKSYFAGLLFSVFMATAFAAPPVREPAGFDFRAVNVSQAVQLIYGEALQDAFVIDPEVVSDQRMVSFRYTAANGELRAFVKGFLDSLGYEVTRRGATDYIAKKKNREIVEPPSEVFVYRPKHRDGTYLVDLVTPFIKGQFSAKRGVRSAAGQGVTVRDAPPGSASAVMDRESDVLVYRGTVDEIKVLAALLPQVDIPVGGVVVKGVLYEVQTGQSDGSAFSLALNLLGSRVGVSVGTQQAGANSISLGNHSIEAVLSILSSDSRFSVKSTPTLMVKSGENGRFQSGDDVPVFGSVSYAGSNGTPVRSVEYRSTGVIFDLTPTVRAESIDLTVLQQVSNVVATRTGVNDTPTFNKREVKTSLSMRDGEIVVIGGLTEEKEASSGSGLPFIPAFLHSKSSDKTRTEILLLLQVSKNDIRGNGKNL